jgi:F0F1-type ATP synthase assembly protein I
MADDNDSQLVKAGRFAALGTEFGVTIVAGVVLGYYLDEWLGTSPLLMLVVSMAAFGGSIYRMVAMLKRFK